MALTVALSGSDTIQINNQVLSTLANQNPGRLTFPSELMNVEAGKNGVAVYAENKQGLIAELAIRLALGGVDDKYLNSLLQQQLTGFSSTTLITAVFTKRVGDGSGNITNVVYQLYGGMVQKGIEAIESASGDIEESVAVWPIRFGQWIRLIQ
ncbi:MAG: hypothetical protein KGJ13_04675 [Patescibacteria group bacterium]|nr:hypothetical protein [Patescibacteria group bacterium]